MKIPSLADVIINSLKLYRNPVRSEMVTCVTRALNCSFILQTPGGAVTPVMSVDWDRPVTHAFTVDHADFSYYC